MDFAYLEKEIKLEKDTVKKQEKTIKEDQDEIADLREQLMGISGKADEHKQKHAALAKEHKEEKY